MLDQPSSRSAAQAHLIELEWSQIGPHRFRIEEDVIHWQFFGEVTLEHVQQGMRASESIYERYGYRLSLMNAGGVARMSAEARRYLGEQSRNRRFESCAAIFNAGLVGIAISYLIAGATRVFSGSEPTFSILKTEADARSWLGKQRQRIREKRRS